MPTEHLPGIWLLDAFRRGGVDTAALRQRVPGDLDEMLRHPAGLKPDTVNRILMACAAQSGDANFGLHMTEFVTPAMLGTYGYLLLNTPTVGRFMELAERYYPTFYRGAELHLSKRGAVARLEYRLLDPPTVSTRHDNEWTLAFFVGFIRSGLGSDWFPRGVSFSNPAPVDPTELQQALGPEISFDQPTTHVDFDLAILDRKLNQGDPGLLEILVDQAEGLLAEVVAQHSFESETRLHIVELLGEGRPAAAGVARRMAISLSGLKRRLGERGLSFRTIRDDVIRDLASKALVDTDLQVSTIARKLGYSELSAFDRAFKRITGMTPSRYRAVNAQSERRAQ